MANREDPDILQHLIPGGFHQGLHCLLRQNQSSEKEIQYFFEIITCDSPIYIMDHSDFIISRQSRRDIVLASSVRASVRPFCPSVSPSTLFVCPEPYLSTYWSDLIHSWYK